MVSQEDEQDLRGKKMSLVLDEIVFIMQLLLGTPNGDFH